MCGTWDYSGRKCKDYWCNNMETKRSLFTYEISFPVLVLKQNQRFRYYVAFSYRDIFCSLPGVFFMILHQVHDNELRCAPVALPPHRRPGPPACLPNPHPCLRVHSKPSSLSASCQKRPRAHWFVSPLGPPPSCRRAIDVMYVPDPATALAVHSS